MILTANTQKNRSRHIGNNEYTASLSGSLSVRVYSDARPHNGKIASLQKGLILVFKGTETVGEGTGFGVPILSSSEETYFSGHAQVHVSDRGNEIVILKQFLIDTIARNRFRNVTLQNSRARSLFRYLSRVYQSNRHFQVLDWKRSVQRIGYGRVFLRTALKGRVDVTYTIEESHIHVKADAKPVNKEELRKIFIFNEGSSEFFRRYNDSTGLELCDREIGAWTPVEADWAAISNPRGNVGFRLKNVRSGCLRRGREFLEGSLDWIGLDYETSPRNLLFEYDIEILGT